jgi:hypothetical protein
MTSNPFSTRFIRPGAIPFIFPAGESAETFVGRLRERAWRGQIIGPHGSGKSTLLATLVPALEAAGRQVIAIALHQGEHRQPPLVGQTFPSADRQSRLPDLQLVIDGYEQLSWWSKRRVKSLCKRAGCGLLVTTHADMGLTTIFSTQPSDELAQAVVTRLLANGPAPLAAAEISAAFIAADGNLRETLFKLYDVYQQGRR